MQKVFDKFGLTESKIQSLDRPRRSLLLLIGLVVVMLFATLVSIAPQISSRFGEIAKKKESQISNAANNTPPCGKYGDVNNNGQVDPIDALLIERYDAGIANFTNEVKKWADVNGDMDINPVDALLVKRFDAGLIFTFPMCVDHDEDGFVDGAENYIGTDPYKKCGSNAWPPDFNSDRFVNMVDLQKFIQGYYNPNFDKRYDLNMDKRVNIPDFYAFRPYYYKNCSVKSAPAISFSADKTVFAGGTVNLSWQSSRSVAPCVASSNPDSNWKGHKQTIGSQSVNLAKVGNYSLKLTCYGPGGTRSKSINVTIEAPPPPPAQSAVKILPLGDSITVGAYRSYLQGLIPSSYDVDFIGSQTGGASDPEHEGHVGWSSGKFLDGSLTGWLQSYTPDIVLIHLGTNDIGGGCYNASSSVPSNLKQIINLLKADNSNVKVIVSKIIPLAICSDTLTRSLNTQIQNQLSGIINVYIVDSYSGFNTSTDLAGDNVHPNNSGANKIAKAFWGKLKQLL